MTKKLIIFILSSNIIISCSDVQNQGARVVENAGSVVRTVGKDFWHVPGENEKKQCKDRICESN